MSLFIRSGALNILSKRGLASTKKVLPEFTKDRYPVTRGDYASISDKDVAKFESILDKHRVITGDEAQGYNVDWIGSVRGDSNVVLRPKTTEEVSEILKHCNARKLAVVPQGGNTGLVRSRLLLKINENIFVHPLAGWRIGSRFRRSCHLNGLDESN
jgi:hypothetical protein